MRPLARELWHANSGPSLFRIYLYGFFRGCRDNSNTTAVPVGESATGQTFYTRERALLEAGNERVSAYDPQVGLLFEVSVFSIQQSCCHQVVA